MSYFKEFKRDCKVVFTKKTPLYASAPNFYIINKSCLTEKERSKMLLFAQRIDWTFYTNHGIINK